MKNLLLTIICITIALGISAQTIAPGKPFKFIHHAETKYCVTLVDGKTAVLNNDKPILNTVKLKSGARLTKSGTIIWKDNSRTKLENGQCMDESGTIKGSTVVVKENTENGKTINERIHTLPEVSVVVEKIKGAEKRHHAFGTDDEDSNNAFEQYIKNAKAEVAQNEKTLMELRLNAVRDNKLAGKRYEKEIASLEIENAELETELDNYVKNGVGYWMIFKNEFNKDLAVLSKDCKSRMAENKK